MTSNQTKILLEKFKINPYLEEKERDPLATSLNISAESVAVWFASRRSSQRKKEFLAKGKYSSTELACNQRPICVKLHIQDRQMNTHTE